MEFWRVYRLVKAKRWVILCLMVITLVTVFIAKRVIDANTEYVASAIVVPSPLAMNPNGLYHDSAQAKEMSQTASRYTRLALFIQSIESHAQEVIGTPNHPGLLSMTPQAQKLELAKAFSDDLPSDQQKAIADGTIQETDLDKILQDHQISINPALWVKHDLSPDEMTQLLNDLSAAPVVRNEVNQTPGATNPTPTITDYIQIDAHAPDKLFAQQLANLVAAKFINAYYQDGQRDYNAQMARLKANRAEAIARLNTAQTDLSRFQMKTGLIDLNSQAAARVADMEKMVLRRNQAQVELEAYQQSVKALQQIMQSNKLNYSIPLDPKSDREGRRLLVEVQNAKADLEAAQARYRPEHPVYKQAQAAVKAKQDAYNEFIKQPFVASQVNPQYFNLNADLARAKDAVARAQGTIQTLDAQIQQAKRENASTLPSAQKEYSLLKIAYDTAMQDKTVDDKALENLELAGKTLDYGLITLVNPASYAIFDTSGPSLAALLIYAALLSLIFGVVAVIGLDYLDNTVQTIPDAEKLLGMPVSAVIPALPAGDPKNLTRLTLTDPLSPIAESYRLLRTDLLFTAEDKPFKSMMVATAKPGQGATTTICNLAVSLAQVGKRVVLIDGDLRRPRLHDYFSVSNETGLTSLLRGECEMEEALKVTDIDNLLVLPSGPLPLNPAELLSSQKMRTLHERLKPHTDFILVDTPSAIAFSDAAILASFLDAVLLVVRAQETPRGSEVQVKDMLNKARANVVGVVLNGVKPQLVDSYYYHAAYYPQVTTSNGHSLPPPANGNGNGYERTLEGDTLGHRLPAHAFSRREGGADDQAVAVGADEPDEVERTVIMDDIVDVKPAARRRFSLRSLFGTDDRGE